MRRTELWAALLDACKGGHSWELARLCQDADEAALAAAEAFGREAQEDRDRLAAALTRAGEREEAADAALADERRHADALLNALHNPDNITVERAIEAHHARRAAEVE